MSASLIAGYGLLSPLGNHPEEILGRMLQGERAVQDIEGFDASGLDFPKGGELKGYKPITYLGKKGLRQLDRTGKLAASAANLTLEATGLDAEFREANEIALVLGTNFCSAGTIAAFDQRGLEQGPGAVSPLDFANTVINAAAGQVAIRYQLRGTNTTTTGGGCAGLKALGYGHELVTGEREQWVLAGGAEELTEVVCTAYDKSPYMGENGLFLSEGAAFVLLTPQALEDQPVSGRILDHASRTFYSTGDVDMAASAVESFLRHNGLQPDDVGLICLSAAGHTPVDTMEQEVLNRLFSPETARFQPKYWLGEGLGVSGPLQLLLSLEVLKQGRMPRIDADPLPIESASKIVLLMGLNPDGLFDMLLASEDTDAA